DAGGLVALLGNGSLVDQPDDAQLVVARLTRRRQVMLDDATLDSSQHRVVVPGVMGEELLKRANGGAGRQRHRLDAFARQIADQPATVGAQMRERVASGKTRPQ